MGRERPHPQAPRSPSRPAPRVAHVPLVDEVVIVSYGVDVPRDLFRAQTRLLVVTLSIHVDFNSRFSQCESVRGHHDTHPGAVLGVVKVLRSAPTPLTRRPPDLDDDSTQRDLMGLRDGHSRCV